MKLAVREAGQGPPLLLLHGLFGQARNLATLQASLAPRHRTLAFDLRNHGGSLHADGMGYAALADDVRETLAALGIARCAVLGHSMGGKVAMFLALTAPEAVSRLLVADIAPVAYPNTYDAIVAALRGLDLDATPSRAAADTALAAALPEPGLRAFLLQNLVPGRPAQWRIGLAEIAAGLPDLLGWPAADAPYVEPTLFVAGGRSDYIGLEQRAPIKALFPQARVLTLKDAGHWLHADAPGAFAEVAGGFFEARPGALPPLSPLGPRWGQAPDL